MSEKKIISRKAIEVSLLFGILCAIFLSFADFNAACDELRSNVLRLHIIANSDSIADQELKLKIRDSVLAQSENLFEEITDLEDAINAAEANVDEIKEIADKVIKENGYNYSVNAYVGDSYFGTREYEDFTLPAGTYKSVIIEIGEAKGKNWWCVIFPQLCLPAAEDAELSDVVDSQSAEVAENPDKYIIRFKTVEIYENFKKLLQ